MKCERCPMGEGVPCAGEAGRWAGLACRMAASGEAGVRWVVDKSTGAAPEPPVEPPAYPPLATQAANLAGSVVRFVASGLKTVDKAEYNRRRSICLACPTGRYDAEQDRCTVCGCAIAVKPWGKAESCPEGHW